MSNYRTGLSIEDAIDEYEEGNKIWHLALTGDIFTDTKKTLVFRQILGLTIPEIADIKKNTANSFESGSKTRLTKIQYQLSLNDISTSLTQRTVTDKSGT